MGRTRRIFTAHKRRSGQAYIFRSVCHSVQRGREPASRWVCLQVGSASRGSAYGRAGVRIRKTGGTHPTGMLSCFSGNLTMLQFLQSYVKNVEDNYKIGCQFDINILYDASESLGAVITQFPKYLPLGKGFAPLEGFSHRGCFSLGRMGRGVST